MKSWIHIVSNHTAHASAALLFTVMIVMPQSYFLVKFTALCFFFIAHGAIFLLHPSICFKRSDFFFYLATWVLGSFWSFVGSINGNVIPGILSGMKLYLAWGVIFLVLITLRRKVGALIGLDSIFVVSTLLICFVNIFSVIDAFFNLEILSKALIEELDLRVGLHDQYIRLNSNNIASLFFLVPYLMAQFMLKKESVTNSFWSSLALLLGMVLVLISGRRALWGVGLMIPAIVITIATLSGQTKILKFSLSKVVLGYLSIALGVLIAILVVNDNDESVIIDYFLSAFSEEDERSIQKVYLLESFFNQPWFGSGLGGYAGYPRNLEFHWMYELTYHQILFNFGLIGSVLIALLFGGYLMSALQTIQLTTSFVTLRIGVLVGFICLLIGSYSNPYLQFFDSMIFIMIFIMITEKCRN
jgi:hypothetical protein